MHPTRLHKYLTVCGVALTFSAASIASAQSRVVLPAGSVIIVRTTTPLQSATAKSGQTFDTNVEESVGVDEFTVIPAGSKIRGVISLATPATRQQSGDTSNLAAGGNDREFVDANALLNVGIEGLSAFG